MNISVAYMPQLLNLRVLIKKQLFDLDFFSRILSLIRAKASIYVTKKKASIYSMTHILLISLHFVPNVLNWTGTQHEVFLSESESWQSLPCKGCYSDPYHLHDPEDTPLLDLDTQSYMDSPFPTCIANLTAL